MARITNKERAEKLFDRNQELPLQQRYYVLCYIFGRMKKHFTSHDLDMIEAKIKHYEEA